MSRLPKQDVGRLGERHAVRLLRAHGYRILARNYRTRRGEIDIVAQDGPALAFVEVKTRTGDSFGSPLEAVTPAKQKQVARMAAEYLVQHRITDAPCRFDVVAVMLNERGRLDRIELLRGAFQAPAGT